MFDYLYIILLIVGFAFSIIRNIYLFRKGQYTPYILKGNKGDTAIGIGYCTFLGVSNHLLNAQIIFITTLILLCYPLCLIICKSILNYLSYKKIKEQKIIFQTIALNIAAIFLTIVAWRIIVRQLS